MNKILGFAVIVLIAVCGFMFYKIQKLETALHSKSTSIENISAANGLGSETDPSTQSPFDKPGVDPEGNKFAHQTTELSPPVAAPTEIKFEYITHDFGKQTNDKLLKTKFKFTNTGKNPLIISNAIGSCGCTVPLWPKEPIAPGSTDEIYIEFDPKGKTGENSKTISVSANTNPTITTLTVKALLVPKTD